MSGRRSKRTRRDPVPRQQKKKRNNPAPTKVANSFHNDNTIINDKSHENVFDLKPLFAVSEPQRQLLEKAEEAGVIELQLWPMFLREAVLSIENNVDGGKQEKEDVPKDFDLNKAAYVLALLVNLRSRRNSGSVGGGSGGIGGSIGGILSFTSLSSSPKPSADAEEGQRDKNIRVKAFRILLTKLLQYEYSGSRSSYETDKERIETCKAVFLISTCNSGCKESNDVIRAPLLEMLGIGLWSTMPSRYRDLQLNKYAAFRRRWNIYCSSCDKKNDDGEKKTLESYLPQLAQLTLTVLEKIGKVVLDEGKGGEHGVGDHDEGMSTISTSANLTSLNFLHTSLQLLLDLLSTTSTRRYLRPYLLSINFSVKCTLSPLFKSFFSPAITADGKERSRLFLQLMTMLQDLETFGVQDITASPLSSAEMASMYHERAHTLQKLSHRHYPEELSQIIYAGVGMVCETSFLKKSLQIAESSVVEDLAHRLRLIDKNMEEFQQMEKSKKREFVMEVMMYHHILRPSELQTLSRLPLYPDESLLWNPHLVPSGNPTMLNNSTLALPKLNLQFLTFGDYLLRTFKLLRLESAYEIRSDLVGVIKRMRPVPCHGYDEDVDDEMEEDAIWRLKRAKAEFHGWARMGLELPKYGNPVKILKVSPPKLGEDMPSQVLAEITLDLRRCGEQIRKEWDEVGEFDNLFLVAADATSMEGGPAPLLDDVSSSFKTKNNNDEERRIPDEEDVTFPRRFGIVAVRGCMVLEVRDEDGTVVSDPSFAHQKSDESKTPKGMKRFLRVALDPSQYAADATMCGSPLGTNVYKMMNVVIRRHGKENNFKAVLETIRGLMQGTGSVNRSIPSWLRPVLLGYGDPSSACFTSSKMKKFARETPGVTPPDTALDYGDTFLDEDHLRNSFALNKIVVDGQEETHKESADKKVSPARRNYRIKIVGDIPDSSHIEATSYSFSPNVTGNPVRFTPIQVKAIQAGLSPGLTLIVGPPGTGKTDVAVQIIANYYHSFPTQRTVLVTHSNAALNDLFEKVMARGDVDERYMLRLGSGERNLQNESEFDFSKVGRVNYILAKRASLLEKVQCLSESLGISGTTERGADGSPSYTCETAGYFNLHHIQKRVQIFKANWSDRDVGNDSNIAIFFPFKKYFHLKDSDEMTVDDAKERFDVIREIFDELEEYRPLELLRSQRQRTDYLLTKQARIVAMTCTHAAIARSHLIKLGFQYDNLVMEEAGQMLDVETFVPLLLQKGEYDKTSYASSRLKRICFIGDHHQLPPVVKNASFSKYSNLDQSLFTRLIRLGVPSIDLNKQGRSRSEIANLYSWRYKDLGNLEHISTMPVFSIANAGFAHTFQVINVEEFEGRGESTPTAYFYQNVGEAEYAVALFQYMVLIGYSPGKISILTTYNGQKELLNDILSQRCGEGTPLAGVRPGAVSTVDHYQGQQNDYVILSLVRTKAVGHLRDIRRLVVAVSRARLGLYVFCRQSIFVGCHELRKTMDQFSKKTNTLELVTGEQYPTTRKVTDKVQKGKTCTVKDVTVLGSIVHSMENELCPNTELPTSSDKI